jgi:hypothetical protein
MIKLEEAKATLQELVARAVAPENLVRDFHDDHSATNPHHEHLCSLCIRARALGVVAPLRSRLPTIPPGMVRGV